MRTTRLPKPHSLAHVMSDEDDGASSFSPDALQFVVQQIARLSIEGGERLVHQQYVGFSRQRASQCDALTHATGKLVRAAVLELRKMNESQVVANFLLRSALLESFHLHAELDVLANGQPRKQSVLLEYQDAIGPRPVDSLVVDQDCPESVFASRQSGAAR